MKLKLIPCFLLFTVCFCSSVFSAPQKQSRDSVLMKNLREEVALSQRLIKQLQGDKTKLQREVKRLKESLKSLEVLNNAMEDSLENEIQVRNDTIEFKQSVILMLTTHLQLKRDTIIHLCEDTTNYGTRYRNSELLSKQKDEWTKQQTKALGEHRATLETLRVSFFEIERVLKQQNAILQHKLDSLNNFIQTHPPIDTTKQNFLNPPK